MREEGRFPRAGTRASGRRGPLRHFLVDVPAGRHPLDVPAPMAPAVPETVAVLDLPART